VSRIAVIGFGAIGREVVCSLSRIAAESEIAAVLVRPGTSAHGGGIPFVTTLDELLAARPTVVIECASAASLAATGAPILRAGCTLIAASVSALIDDKLSSEFAAAARAGGGRLLVPSGAVGAADALAAMRLAGLEKVLYRGIKPPAAWRGTHAEALCDLAGIAASQTFFTGTARQAAKAFPQNANVAAIVGLAGVGLDATAVELVAEPAAIQNRHEIAATSAAGSIVFQSAWHPSPQNPKTSAIIAYSLLSCALSGTAAITIS
jgi:aspartate dehydrogenase